MASRPTYGGLKRKLVLAFNIGARFSRISYSMLEPGKVPEISHVKSGASDRIPSIIYYDRSGKVRAAGAEATTEAVCNLAEKEKWTKFEWFTLHLCGKSESDDLKISSPLPLNQNFVQLFAKFLRYLFHCAAHRIKKAYAIEPTLWESIKNDMELVISYPSGCGRMQQNEMRRAIVISKLIPDTTAGHARLSFVAEGEASLYFSIQNGLPVDATRNGDGIGIVNAGGGAIDISFYHGGKKGFEEIAAPQCHFQGSVFVTLHAKTFLSDLLADSAFASDLDYIVACFDRTTKRRFRDSTDYQFVRFGAISDNDERFNICCGQLKLEGSDVAKFFQPSIDCIVNAFDQRKVAHVPVSHVVLVGGFSANDWLYRRVKDQLEEQGLTVIRPEKHADKAGSDGAVSFYLNHCHMSKVSYGHFFHIPFEANQPDHMQRINDMFTSLSGSTRIGDVFDVILPKSTLVTETTEFRRSYFLEFEKKSDFNKVAEFDIWCYRGQLDDHKWKDQNPENYTKLCTISLDLSKLPLTARPKPKGQSGSYYQLDYDIVLSFGLTVLNAQIAWKDKQGTKEVEQRSSVEIIHEPDTTNDDP